MLVLPVLLVVFFGIVELSRAWHTLNIVTTAAREGTRVGTLTPLNGGLFDPSAAQLRIDRILAAANLGVTDNGDGTYTLTGATRTVTCTPTPCVSGSEVRADVSVTFDTAVPLVLPILKLLTIEQSASMRYE